MGLLTKVKELFTGSIGAEKGGTHGDVETMTDVKQKPIEVEKKAEGKKDNCCGGNCGS